jgi:hypothetical protein
VRADDVHLVGPGGADLRAEDLGDRPREDGLGVERSQRLIRLPGRAAHACPPAISENRAAARPATHPSGSAEQARTGLGCAASAGLATASAALAGLLLARLLLTRLRLAGGLAASARTASRTARTAGRSSRLGCTRGSGR